MPASTPENPLRPPEDIDLTQPIVAVLKAEADAQKELDEAAWQFVTVRVKSPGGYPRGWALFMLAERVSSHDHDRPAPHEDDSSEAKFVMEVAHFERWELLERFTKEFFGFLMPGILEGPELAREVALFEGMSGNWQPLSQTKVAEFLSDDCSIIRAFSDWKPYDPQAERKARIRAGEIDF